MPPALRPTLRSKVSVNITSLAKLASGDVNCIYRGWADSHYIPERLSDDFDLDGWIAEHTVMLHKVTAGMMNEGWAVFVEGRNSFKVVGQTGAVLSGRADLVAVRDDTAMVIDCKTGRYRRSHAVQVRLYMYFLGHHQSNHPAHGCSEILGRVLYNHCKVDIPAAAIDTVPEILKRYMPLLISDTAPASTPSYSECRFCDIGKELCPERIDTEPPASSTDLF